MSDDLPAPAPEPSTPHGPPGPPGPSARCRQALRSLGGIASARAIALVVASDGGAPLSLRRVKEALRCREVRGLGGGYLAMSDSRRAPLVTWLVARLDRGGPLPVSEVVTLVLERWPHGDPRAVQAWLHQDPPGLVVVDGIVRAPDPGGARTKPAG